MIDGKVAQVLTDTPSGSTCTFCGAPPRQMNNLTKVTARPENENAYQYGLSTLHAWIRCISFQTCFVTTEEKKGSSKKRRLKYKSDFV
jgi:hypothetical protein